MALLEMKELLVGATKTLSVPITDPTSFPTIVPDPPVYHHIGTTGRGTLWTVFVLMTLAFLAFLALARKVPSNQRIVHSLASVIVLISALSYLAMATGSGHTWYDYRSTEKHDHGLPDTHITIHRQVFWVRLLDWFLSTPLIFTALALVGGLNGESLFSVIVANLVMSAGGLFASLSWKHNARWTWLLIIVIAHLWIIYQLALGAKSLKAKRAGSYGFYTSIMAYTVLIMVGYPLVLAIATSSRKLSIDAETFAFAVLDFLTKGVFGAWLLAQHKTYASTVNLGDFWSNGLNPEGAIRVIDDDGDEA